MKKSCLSLLVLVLALSVFFTPNNAAAIDYTDDNSCMASYPYTLESSESVFENGSLGQSFVPTQNRLNTLILDLLTNAADDESVMTVSITDFNEETTLASKDVGITASMDGGNMHYIDFYRNGLPYDVPLTPGDTYKIKITTTAATGNLRWAFKEDSNCAVGGASIVAGVMNLGRDFGFTTKGYNYVAPVVVPVAPVVTPTATPTPAPSSASTTTVATTPTSSVNSSSSTAASVSNAAVTATSAADATQEPVLADSESASLKVSSGTDDVKSKSSILWQVIAGIIVILMGFVTFLQFKFKIISKIFGKKKKSVKKMFKR